jgi:hypothetical protein
MDAIFEDGSEFFELIASSKSVGESSGEHIDQARVEVSTPCQTVPSDENDEPNGKTMLVVTPDIWISDISTLHRRPIELQHVQLGDLATCQNL